MSSTTSDQSRKNFRSLGELVCAATELLQPPERMKVSEAAEKYVRLNNPGAYRGPYKNSEAPYMREPMDEFTSRYFSGLIFVGPAQTGKTQGLILNAIAYSIVVDPMDTIVFNPGQAAARDFSIRRIDRMHRDSPEVGSRLLRTREADNVFDKQYISGMMLNLSHPTSSTLAGRPIPRVVITDRDRMDDDIDKEGEVYDLAAKRTTSFGTFGICVAESSPSRPITNLRWVRSSPHEAPPCGGILGLYNRGDRRRLYWPCPHCGEYFEGNFRMLKWDRKSNTMDAGDSVYMECPHESCNILPDERYDMLQKSVWLADGQMIDRDGNIYGEKPRTDIASFWMNGVAAIFTNWPKLVRTFITAEEAYERTGDEEALKKFYNNDLGEPYTEKSFENLRLPEVLASRAEPLGGTRDAPVVPFGVRFLVATVDVQNNMFIVQIHGIMPGEPFDMVIIDRFRIKLNALGRLDEDQQLEWVKPGTYQEDWDQITEKVIKKTYPLADGSGRHMGVKLTLCDSGGKAGVTANAYKFYRKLRRLRMHTRFQLVKGESRLGSLRTKMTRPDSNDPKNKAAANGEIPVLLLNSNMIKDMLSNRLDATIPGNGMIHYPDWLPDWFYAELCVEERTEKGWIRPPHTRNEAWDLAYYCIGGCLSGQIDIEKMDFSKTRTWYSEWSDNVMIIPAEATERFAIPKKPSYDYAALAKQLA